MSYFKKKNNSTTTSSPLSCTSVLSSPTTGETDHPHQHYYYYRGSRHPTTTSWSSSSSRRSLSLSTFTHNNNMEDHQSWTASTHLPEALHNNNTSSSSVWQQEPRTVILRCHNNNSDDHYKNKGQQPPPYHRKTQLSSSKEELKLTYAFVSQPAAATGDSEDQVAVADKVGLSMGTTTAANHQYHHGVVIPPNTQMVVPNNGDNTNHPTITTSSSSSNHYLFAMAQGHNHHGPYCAQFVAEYLKQQQYHNQQKKKNATTTSNSQQQQQLFQHLNQQLNQHPSIDDSMSGTTLLMVQFVALNNEDENSGMDNHNKSSSSASFQVQVSHLGDLRCICGSYRDNRWKATPWTWEHTLSARLDERQRIRTQYPQSRILSWDQMEGLEEICNIENDHGIFESQEKIPHDPLCLWSPQGDYPGTHWTRTLGDSMAHELGVICEPETSQHTLTPQDQFLVLASDSIFQYLTNQSVIDILSKFDNLVEACRCVIIEAYELYQQFENTSPEFSIMAIRMEHAKKDE